MVAKNTFQPNLTVSLGRLTLQNPIITASGTFGSGIEYSDFLDLNSLGAITLKSITLKPRAGNPPPRVAETPSGLINSIGLENPGLHAIINDVLPKLMGYPDVRVIANIAGHTIDENVECARELCRHPRVDALELNISCPNVDSGGLAFCQDLGTVERLIGRVRDAFDKPLIVKLSLSVPDMIRLAEVSVHAGAEILSLINTIPAMEIDLATRRLFFSRGFGGLSGPAIRPIALKAVYDLSQQVDIPIIGMGGVAGLDDVLKFLLAGATGVSVGMMNFVAPGLCQQLVSELAAYLQKEGLSLSQYRLAT